MVLQWNRFYYRVKVIAIIGTSDLFVRESFTWFWSGLSTRTIWKVFSNLLVRQMTTRYKKFSNVSHSQKKRIKPFAYYYLKFTGIAMSINLTLVQNATFRFVSCNLYKQVNMMNKYGILQKSKFYIVLFVGLHLLS